MTIPPPIIIQNVTENITIITKAFKFTETPQALVGSITIMVVIVCGVLCFIISGICDERKRLRSEKRIGTTNLTDFELKPIDQQDIGYEEAVSFFNSARSMITRQNNVSINYTDNASKTLEPSTMITKNGGVSYLDKPSDQSILYNQTIGQTQNNLQFESLTAKDDDRRFLEEIKDTEAKNSNDIKLKGHGKDEWAKSPSKDSWSPEKGTQSMQ